MATGQSVFRVARMQKPVDGGIGIDRRQIIMTRPQNKGIKEYIRGYGIIYSKILLSLELMEEEEGRETFSRKMESSQRSRE